MFSVLYARFAYPRLAPLATLPSALDKDLGRLPDKPILLLQEEFSLKSSCEALYLAKTVVLTLAT